MIKAEDLKDIVKFRRVIGTEPYLTNSLEMDIKDIWATFVMTTDEYLLDYNDCGDKILDTWDVDDEEDMTDDDGDYEPSYWFREV